MGFVVKGGCECECEREYFHNGEVFTTLRKAINTIKSDVEWLDFFYEYDGEFYIYDTETGDKIHYNYDGKRVKRIKLYKNEPSKYKLIKKNGCSFDDKYYPTLRRSFEAMRSIGTGWYILVNLETNEKKLYFSDGHHVRMEKDPVFIRLYSRD